VLAEIMAAALVAEPLLAAVLAHRVLLSLKNFINR
jgi:hypothetical protein